MKHCPVCTNEYPTGELCPNDGAALLPRDEGDPLIGRLIKQSYKIENELGSGGMGVVYRARQLSLDRDVAIKVLRMAHQNSDEQVQRFFREAKLASQLQHPNVVGVIDFGNTNDGLLFLVLEYLKGTSLKDYIQVRGGLTMAEIVRCMEQLCSGVSAAHALSIVHRDLKPQNVLVTELPGGGEQVKVLDFGISKSLTAENEQHCTQTNILMGSPGYLAPEQIESSRSVDTRADIYALGAILYYMIAGHPPFSGDNWTAVLARQLSATFDPVEPDEVVDQQTLALMPVVEKAMHVSADERYQTANELIAAIREVVKWDVHGSMTVSTFAPPISEAPMTRWGRAIGAVLACVMIFSTAGIYHYASHPDRMPKAVLNPGSTDRGVTANEIRIGVSAPFSGQNREFGRSVKLGLDVAIRDINERGGVYGRNLKLFALDDRYEPTNTVENAKKLLENEEVFAFIGNVGTATSEAILPYLLEKKAILLGAVSGANSLRKDPPDRYVFNLRASYDEETAGLVNYLVTERHVAPSRIAVVTQDDAYGEAGFQGVAKALRSRGIRSEQISRFSYPRNTLEIDHAVNGVVAKLNEIDAVLFVGTYAPSVEFTVRIRPHHPKLIIANLSFTGNAVLREEFRERGKGLGEGVILTQVVPPFDSYASVALNFRELLARYYPNETPGSMSLEAFIAMRLFIRGLEKTGPDLTTEKLTDTLETMRGVDLGFGAPINFSPSKHQGSQKVWGLILKANGEYDTIELNTANEVPSS